MSHSNRKPKSPYARHGKKPYLYSDAYQRWHDAALDPSSSDHERLGLAAKHSLQFLGYVPQDYPTGQYPRWVPVQGL